MSQGDRIGNWLSEVQRGDDGRSDGHDRRGRRMLSPSSRQARRRDWLAGRGRQVHLRETDFSEARWTTSVACRSDDETGRDESVQAARWVVAMNSSQTRLASAVDHGAVGSRRTADGVGVTPMGEQTRTA